MNVIKKPHLPDYDVSLFVCDNVLNSGSNFLPSFTLSDVLFGINSHPDMSVCPLFDGDVIVAKEGYCYYKKILPETIAKELKSLGFKVDISELYKAQTVANLPH